MKNPPARMTTVMSGYGGNGYGGKPQSPPPDLPSLLCDQRILFLGMPLVPSVTELLVAELLFMNYDKPDKPIFMYINSSGSQTPEGEPVALDSEAFAILDTMQYVDAEVQTVCIQKAHGNAMLLLAGGAKGKRFSFPNASLMTTPPRIGRNQDSVSNLMIKANELENTTSNFIDSMQEFTGQPREQVEKDMSRTRYFTAEQAIEYGLIDRVVPPSKKMQERAAANAANHASMLDEAAAKIAGSSA